MLAYTAICGNKDLRRHDIRVFSDYDKFKSPVFNSKIYKILPHHFLDTDISVWMDGNIYLNVPLEQLVKEWLGEADIAFFRHYKSKNIDWEKRWIAYKFGRKSQVTLEVEKQYKRYEHLNIKKEEMLMGGFIIRRHTPLVEAFNNAWWSEICAFGERDQMSLPVVLRKFPELKVNRINLDIKNNEFLTYSPHNFDVL